MFGVPPEGAIFLAWAIMADGTCIGVSLKGSSFASDLRHLIYGTAFVEGDIACAGKGKKF